MRGAVCIEGGSKGWRRCRLGQAQRRGAVFRTDTQANSAAPSPLSPLPTAPRPLRPSPDLSELWLKATFFSLAFICIPYTLVVMKHELGHRAHEKEHGKHRGPQYPFMRVRRKAFPWEASDCDYLDLDCHAEFQKAKAARKAGIE